MDKYEIIRKIENFAPVDTQESWDCSGWVVNAAGLDDVNKVMLCLTVTDDVVKQAIEQNCDMIISHHPMFYISLNSALVSKSHAPKINIYCAHTNMDKANGGTTDTLIEKLGFSDFKLNIEHEFLRIVEKEINTDMFSDLIGKIFPNARIVNPKNINTLHKIAFCAGSGSEFIKQAQELGADCLVTGDLKFHTALESSIVLYDIGHFESEIPILTVFEKLISNSVEVVYAQEVSPFVTLCK